MDLNGHFLNRSLNYFSVFSFFFFANFLSLPFCFDYWTAAATITQNSSKISKSIFCFCLSVCQAFCFERAVSDRLWKCRPVKEAIQAFWLAEIASALKMFKDLFWGHLFYDNGKIVTRNFGQRLKHDMYVFRISWLNDRSLYHKFGISE